MTTSPSVTAPDHAAANSATPSSMEAIATCMAREILAGDVGPGDSFPRELDLCQRFDASRNRLRNALAQLVSAGLLERTAGRGTVVRTMSEWQLLDPLMSHWISGLQGINPDLMREIYAFRLSVEPYVSALAAMKANAQDLARLERAFEGMVKTANDTTRDAHAEYDVAFHEAIYHATHNLVWTQLGSLLRPSISQLIQSTQQAAQQHDHSHHRASLDRHRAVMEAIRLRQPDMARTCAERVLETAARDLGFGQDHPRLASPSY
ncbi:MULTISPECIES: FadR/GntR family transcriptional regulator [Cobetia]|uniref:FadR family transcriptional regulator n=1 Tax=Cobetia crustatorum TaxID=553385 RepID=A0A558HKH3_9GAMM|nr:MULTISPECIES: FadR/GntR family transcriptional regulator [Cobetia]TVU69642.1 FadR family transcriptional regulator [Cobetia crustatorum]